MPISETAQYQEIRSAEIKLVYKNLSILSAICNPKLPPGSKEAIKSFNFDYSYWSHTDVSLLLSDKNDLVLMMCIFVNKTGV